MKSILVINFSNLKSDARVRRHVTLLKDHYSLTIACFDADPSGKYKFVPLKKQELTLLKKLLISFFLGIRWFSQAYRLLYPYEQAFSKTTNEKFDLIIGNDIESLPLAFFIAAKHKCPVVFDAHEYAPRHFEDRFLWRLFFQPFNVHLCKKYIRQTAAMITIGKGLANEYEKNFAVKPVVITNANHYHELAPSLVMDKRIRLVHHGIVSPSRKLELMIEMMSYLDDRFSLDMYLMVPSAYVSGKTRNYLEQLKAMVETLPRVRILPPIKSEEIALKINEYDMGVFLIPPVNFNYENTLPNKLFDFIQARLGIAVGPTPEMAEIVHTYNLGVVSEDFTPKKLADKLNQITTDQVELFKANASRAAAELNAEQNKKILMRLLEDVF